MSGKKSRDKGARREREIVHRYMDIRGVFAERIPLSGAMGTYKGDVKVYAGSHEWTAEIKARATGFKQLYTWLGKNDILHLIADRQEPLVVLPWFLWKCIVEKLSTEGIHEIQTPIQGVDGSTPPL